MKRLIWGVLCVLVWGTAIRADEIIELTETSVAEFMLPDGGVLTNAYAWRRSSEGIMIIHDGGNYFLIFKTLPPEWKAVYLRPVEEVSDGTVIVEGEEKPEPPTEIQDRYELVEVLKSLPLLESSAQQMLLEALPESELDQQLLSIGMLQSLLNGKTEVAKRLRIFMEEQKYKSQFLEEKNLFSACLKCGGSGLIKTNCKICLGTGKCIRCDGSGKRKSAIDNSEIHCTTCRGTGTCSECNGVAKFTFRCPVCSATGKVLKESYCKILLNHFVRLANAAAQPERAVTVMQGQHEQIVPILQSIAGLTEEALLFYRSDGYDGQRDVDLLTACYIHLLLQEEYVQADYFLQMADVEFGNKEALKLGVYVFSCKSCGGSGAIERICSSCDGSGKCVRCEGTGERKLEIGAGKITCITCRGTGKCPTCNGVAKFKVRCPTCAGRGKVLDRNRSEIKMVLLLGKLNVLPVEDKADLADPVD